MKSLQLSLKRKLDTLGVRVSALEKKTNSLEKKASTFKMTGYARIRYQENDGLQGYTSSAVTMYQPVVSIQKDVYC